MALEPIPHGDWASATGSCLEKAGYTIHRRRQQMLAWTAQESSKGVRYAEAIRLSRLWLGPRRHALCVVPKRVYLDDRQNVLDTPEREIIDTPSPRPGVQRLIEMQVEAMVALQRHSDQEMRRVDLEPLPVEPPKVLIGSAIHPYPDEIDHLYKSEGYDSVPDKWTVTVCPADGVSSAVAQQFMKALETSAARRRAALSVRLTGVTDIEAHLEKTGRGEVTPKLNSVLLFVLPDRDRPPGQRLSRVLNQLDMLGVQYRRAYQRDDLRFSIPTQLPSLLVGSSGTPHRISVEWRGRSVWSIGIDLSHRRGSESRLAVALVDPEGHLVDSWVFAHRRDETVNESDLRLALKQANEIIEQRDSGHDLALVLRDGKVLENEQPGAYLEPLSADGVLLEIRKGGNPQVMLGSTPDDPPTAAGVPGTQTVFLVPTPVRTGARLPVVRKVTWESGANRPGMTSTEIAQALIDLTAAPSLGTKRYTVPAPIYWADGIAGAGDHDLRFRGNGTVIHERPAPR